MLSRKPGSDRGNYEGKISSFICSPGSQRDQNYEDRFANESCGSRNSDYSVSSCGDPFRVDAQSPNFQEAGYSSPPSQPVRDILIDNARPHTTISYSQSTVKSESNGIHRSQVGDTNLLVFRILIFWGSCITSLTFLGHFCLVPNPLIVTIEFPAILPFTYFVS